MRRSRLCAVYIIMALLMIYGTAYAKTITVTTTSDSGAGSLRQAVSDASDGDMIEFDPSMSDKTIAVGSYIGLRNLLINGLGSNRLTLKLSQQGHIITEGDVSIAGLTITGGYYDMGGGIESYGKLRLNDLVINGNYASDQGGGIFIWDGEVVISNSVIKANSSYGDGAGIFKLDGNLTIVNSSIVDNVGLNRDCVSCSSYKQGVGISNYRGNVSIINSTISGNKEKFVGSCYTEYRTICFDGGGISNGGVMTVLNSTISNNYASEGGGVLNWGEITLTHTTITNNHYEGVQNAGGVFILKNSLIANNYGDFSAQDCAGTIKAEGHNIILNPFKPPLNNTPTPCVISGEAVSNADPKLGPLSDNGGSTFTHALLPGSPAIDKGDSAYCSDTDQRGVVRSHQGNCDIGAFEYVKSHTACMHSTVGDKDNFHLGDIEDISPKSSNAAHLLYDIIGSSHGNPPAELDDSGPDRPVGLTHYVSVPKYANITSAKVTFDIQGTDDLFKNDVIFYKGTGCFFGGQNNLEDNPIILLKYLTDNFSSEQQISVDLTHVPVRLYSEGSCEYADSWSNIAMHSLNLIPLIRQEGKLDLVFTDDTAVNYSELNICYSCSVGDLDGDCDVDMNDLNIIKANLNKFASACPECDLDKDGKITVLDAKKLMNMCNCPQCVCP